MPSRSLCARRWAANASWRACACSNASHVELVQARIEVFQNLDAVFRGCDGILTKRKLIEQHRALPVDLPEREQEIECLQQMNRTDGEIVVPLAPIVVHFNTGQPPAARDEPQLFGRRLAGHDRMTEIHHDADVVDLHVLDREQRARRRAPCHVVAGLASFVFDRELHGGMRCRELPCAAHGEIPELQVIRLQRVVVTVLPRPELHILRTQSLRDSHRFVTHLDCRAANRRVRVGKCAALELARVDRRRDRDGPQ